MRSLGIIAAFLGGAVVGGAIGVLFAPDKGENSRKKIAEALRKRGIDLKGDEMSALVEEISSEIKNITAE